MLHDARGLRITCANQQALDIYDQALTDLWNYRINAPKVLKGAFEHDPEFPMAHIARGYVMSMLESVVVRPKMLAGVGAAREKLAADATRERLHCDALEGLATGNIDSACSSWENILCEFPHDLLALKMHHHTAFWTGRSYAIRNTVLGVYDAWEESIPGFSFVSAMMCFAHEECGDYETAEPYGRRAIEMNGDDLWAIHAVAHVLEMQGRLDDGIRLIERDPDEWADRNPFQGHNWWHLALFSLEKGDFDTVLKIYDERIVTANTEFFLDIQNGASMLKRLELLGVDVGDRWQDLAEYAERQIDDHVLSFTDLHSFMTLAALGKQDVAARYIASLHEFAKSENNYCASITEPLVIPICEGVAAYESGDYDTAVEKLWPLRNKWAGIGGSHAQRDIFTQILIDAALNAGQLHRARNLLAQRVTLRSNSKGSWEKYADVLSRLNLDDKAADARRQADNVH